VAAIQRQCNAKINRRAGTDAALNLRRGYNAFKIKLQKCKLRHAVLIRRRPAPPPNEIKFRRALGAQTAQRPKPNFIAAQRQNFTKCRRPVTR